MFYIEVFHLKSNPDKEIKDTKKVRMINDERSSIIAVGEAQSGEGYAPK